ncbi:hypothetical protein Y032_0051g2134 [Ancylostoma ceylanicum]|uniref:Uncharacterized protein n=1 Tax=Ancylostoma ceylanicum TaxID=53326 RepID=A0A016U8W6_9BILA|nr:hypothetical protein Y032_0051g2134 [Ancylostoma ceylanicum]
MSKRTFIPKWNPHRKPPVVFGGRRRSFRNESHHRYQSRVLNPPGDIAGTHWYGDPFTQGSNQVARIGNERLTQRVGLFRNAKHSEVVINDLSVTIKKACNRQINRLIASDEFPESSHADGDVEPFMNSAVKNVPRDPFQETCCTSAGNEVPNPLIPAVQKVTKKSTFIVTNDSGYEPHVMGTTESAETRSRSLNDSHRRVYEQAHISEKPYLSIRKKG